MLAYFFGAFSGGYLAFLIGFKAFYVVSLFLIVVALYDFYKLRILALIRPGHKALTDLDAEFNTIFIPSRYS